MLEDHIHREILEKFHHLKGSVLIGKERIKGKGKEQRVPADEYVSSEHMMHDLIRGFYKPKGMPFLLSYQATESDENYGKQIVWNDQSLLEFKKIKMAPPSAVKDNRKISDIAAARYNLAHQIPIGLLHKVRKGVNVVLGLGLITEEDINGNFIVVPYLPKTFIGKDFKDANLILPLETNDHQNMVTEFVREIKQRKGQLKFKQYLLEKYSTCTICDVVAKHTIASHIKPWCVVQNRSAEVCNGNVHNSALLF